MIWIIILKCLFAAAIVGCAIFALVSFFERHIDDDDDDARWNWGDPR